MAEKIDVLALAREADLLFNEHLGNEATKNRQNKRINAFAALVLERAALECDAIEENNRELFFEDGPAVFETRTACAKAIRELTPLAKKGS